MGRERPAWAWLLIAFLVAAAPRLLSPERFVTADEGAFWFARSARFEAALARGDLAETWQAPHPGVTTMWAGTIGRAAARAGGLEPDAQDRDVRASVRRIQRAVVGVWTAGALALAAWLAASAWGIRAGALALLLWSVDPFLVGHSRILHTDGLCASFLLVAVCAASAPGIAWARHVGAVAVGLAVLSKLPGAIGLVALVGADAARTWSSGGEARALARRSVVAVALVALTVLVLWPATWAAPATLVRGLDVGVDLGTSPHEGGNFFFGRPVEDPGVAFYPVALALRSTPVVVLGLIAALVAARRRPLGLWGPTLLGALLLVVLTVSAKKFDRYALPVVPWLALVAAVGLDALVSSIASAARRSVVWGAVVVAAVAPLLAVHPYELSWYQPLLGGERVAREVVLFGWGEGLEQIGDALTAAEPDCGKVVATPYVTSLEPFVCHRVVSTHDYARADYVVFYANQLQRRKNARLSDRYVGEREPLAVARTPSGEPIAWLFRRE